jgi:hypothetical protein
MIKSIHWDLYENGEFIESFPSHKKAKSAMHKKIVKSIEGKLGLHYEIKKVVEKWPKVEPQWKTSGFKSLREYQEWYDDICEESRKGLWG